MEDDSITLILFGQEVIVHKKFEHNDVKEYYIELNTNNLIIFRKEYGKLRLGSKLNLSITELQEIIEKELCERYDYAKDQIAKFTKAKNYIKSLGNFKEIYAIKEIIE